MHLYSSLKVCNKTGRTAADGADQECRYETEAASWGLAEADSKASGMTRNYLSKKEGNDNEPDDIIAKGAEGLTESQGLGEDSCSD